MATMYWKPQATAVAQVSTATPANVEVGDIFKLLVGGVEIASFTSAGTTVAGVTAGLTAAWALSSHPYATAITASDQTTHVRLTANTAGIPFTVTSSTTDGGGSNTQSLTIATTTANTGPNVWIAANFSGGALPANSDTVIIENSDVPILWGLDQSGVTLAELRIMQSYTGYIGLPEEKFATAVSGQLITYDTSKAEYRDCYLKIGATLLNIGQNTGISNPGGSSRLKINLGSVQTTARVYGSATASLDGTKQPIRLLGSHNTNTLYVYDGIVGVATTLSSETTNLRYLYQSGGSVTLGAGVSWGDIEKSGGTCYAWSEGSAGVATIDNTGGDLYVYANGGTITGLITYGGNVLVSGACAVTVGNVYGGTLFYNTTGTLGACKIAHGGTLNCLGAAGSQTLSAVTIEGNASIVHAPTLTTITSLVYTTPNVKSSFSTVI